MIHVGLTLPTYRSYATPEHIMATADRAEALTVIADLHRAALI